MAFQIIEKNFGGRGRKSSENVRMRKHGACAHIIIPGKLRNQLSWTAGQSVSIAVGTGTDAGWLRLSLSLDGFALYAVDRAKHLGITANALMAQSASLPTTKCEHLVADGNLYIKLPPALVAPVNAEAIPSAAPSAAA